MTNDERILNLKNVISNKRDALAKSKNNTFITKTNRILDWKGKNYNLNVQSVDSLQDILIELYVTKQTAKDLNIEYHKLNGYSIDDYIDDIKVMLDRAIIREQESELKTLERSLEDLLSEDVKTTLKLNEIENLLK